MKPSHLVVAALAAILLGLVMMAFTAGPGHPAATMSRSFGAV